MSYLSDWKYTHYLFNYNEGFVKRGLVGEALGSLSGYVSYGMVNFFSYIVLGILSVLILLFFSAPYIHHEKRLGALLLMFFAVSSPATLQHFAFDVGRFDLIIYSAFVFLLFSIHRLSVKNPAAIFFMVSLGLVFTVLVHEAAFFMIMPLTLVFWNYIDSSKKSLMLQFFSFSILFVVTFLVSTRGGYSALGFEEHLDSLKAIYGDRVVGSSLNVIHNISIEENLERTINGGVSFARLVHHAAFVFFMLPFFYMLYKLYMSVRSEINFQTVIVLVSSLSPLALYPLGHDHFRWWSLAITNIIFSIFLIVINDEAIRNKVFSFFEENVKLVGLVIFVGFTSGPLGITSSFDVVGYAARVVRYFI